MWILSGNAENAYIPGTVNFLTKLGYSWDILWRMSKVLLIIKVAITVLQGHGKYTVMKRIH